MAKPTKVVAAVGHSTLRAKAVRQAIDAITPVEVAKSMDYLRNVLLPSKKLTVTTKSTKDNGVTPFQAAVWAACHAIPKGQVATYQGLARVVRRFTNPTQTSDKQLATRAVGQALKRNPFAPVVPCHRVVRSDGSLGGFNGFVSGCEIDRKVDLLTKEGVTFTGDGKDRKGVASSNLLL